MVLETVILEIRILDSPNSPMARHRWVNLFNPLFILRQPHERDEIILWNRYSWNHDSVSEILKRTSFAQTKYVCTVLSHSLFIVIYTVRRTSTFYIFYVLLLFCRLDCHVIYCRLVHDAYPCPSYLLFYVCACGLWIVFLSLWGLVTALWMGASVTSKCVLNSLFLWHNSILMYN